MAKSHANWFFHPDEPAASAPALHGAIDAYSLGAGETQITPTSPTQANEITFLNGINPDGTVAAISFDTWNGGNPARYRPPSEAAKWGGPKASDAGKTVEFYFKPVSNWTGTEKAALASGLKLWSDVANIHFKQTHDAGQAQITFERGHDGSAYEFASTSGNAQIGAASIPRIKHATISIDASVPGFGPVGGSFDKYGGYPWETLEREKGHALGLGHGGPYNGDVSPITRRQSVHRSLESITPCCLRREAEAKRAGHS